MLAAAESGNVNTTRKEAAEALRKVVATVGKPGEAGEKVRCVVSVNMLSEGWDANNVTHILGLRAFGSPLLCEQVVGRGLRRLDYSTIMDPQSGREMLTPEYVDIFGVPFSLIPFKGREPGKSTGVEDRLKHEVKALPERKHYEIQFPMVEGFVVALERSLIRCDVSQLEPTRVDPSTTPTAAFIRPQVGIQFGHPSSHGGFGFEQVDRHEYYNSTHPQLIEFEITREIVRALAENTPSGKERLRSQSRSTLFPQVLRIVQAYVRSKVQIPFGVHPCEIGLETYSKRIVGLLLTAIEPDSSHGEPQILPRLNKYQPVGSTANVNFKTVKPVQSTVKSHLNFVACDTQSWEQAVMFQLEVSPHVLSYARNDRLEFTIPYEMYGYPQVYEPDFLAKLSNDTTLIIEAKGQAYEGTDIKHQAAKRWVSAVNNWGKLGRWDFLVCWEPQELGARIAQKINKPDSAI